jgi:endonuclease/exonuclease/phosphatase family metal-dependent hydrolase
MVSRIEVFLRHSRRFISRSNLAITLLGLSRLKTPTAQGGLVMVQIDGLSRLQFNRALKKNHLPFLNRLLQKEHYVTHPFYSGLPSNTPAVQAELFYGVKGCVPAFSFMERSTGKVIRMFDAPFVGEFEPLLKEKGPGLLAGGSSYSNIYSGGAKEAHFCFGQMGFSGIRHALNPFILPFLITLYIDIFARTLLLLVIEICIAIIECLRGTLKGRRLWRELELVWLRSTVCVLLREFIVAGACMDLVRGVPVIHLNFLGFDEQAHGRGPSSRFAHWALRGIDDAIKRIHHVMSQSIYREYDLWVYSDHGQEKTVPYLIKYKETVEQAVKRLFAADAVRGQEAKVAAMGPLGHIYMKNPLTKEETERYARMLVDIVHIPLVMTVNQDKQVMAWTPKGSFRLPQEADKVFGAGHPFLQEVKEDVLCICRHKDAGEFIIAGWSDGEEAISFPLEYGAHAAMGSEETESFALLPVDAPVNPGEKIYLRPTDLREAVQRFLNIKGPKPLPRASHIPQKSLRIMSYNVHGCLGLDGNISPERIARVISRHNPDVICLQELDVDRPRSGGTNQAEKIARLLEMQYHFHPAFRWKDEQYGNAILSRYPLGLMKVGALPRISAETEPRGALWVTVEFQGIMVGVINTHLSLWPKERLLQAQALIGDEWLGHPKCQGPIIVCGDFNTTPASATYREMCKRLKDCQRALPGHRPIMTWMGRLPLSQIDHVFLNTESKVKSIKVPRSSLEQAASDHLPLIVEIFPSF